MGPFPLSPNVGVDPITHKPQYTPRTWFAAVLRGSARNQSLATLRLCSAWLGIAAHGMSTVSPSLVTHGAPQKSDNKTGFCPTKAARLCTIGAFSTERNSGLPRSGFS